MTLARLAGARASLELGDGWSFVPDPDATLLVDDLPAGAPIRVPGSWEEHLGVPGGLVTAWYRRSLPIPGDWQDGLVVLRFGAVMTSCRVFLDGRLVAEHDEGYLPFEADVTAAVVPGATHDLAIRVRNPAGIFVRQPAYSEPGAIARAGAQLGRELTSAPVGKQTWYTATGGLVRPVALERRPRVHLGAVLVRPDLAGAAAEVSYVVRGPGTDTPMPDDAVIRVTVTGPGGGVAGTWSGAVPEGAGTAGVAITDPVPWDIGAPVLYRAEVRLERDGTVMDEVAVRFGMRDVKVRDGRVILNGRPVYLLGALDQDFHAEGRSTPPSRAALDEQVARARELGLNLLRCHITIPDEAYLDAADEAGMLVWCEMPSWIRFDDGSPARATRFMEGMVEALGNHPSLVAWTIINEDWGTDLRSDARHRAWLAAAYEELRALDPTRLAIDNSACGRPGEENVHVRSDLADFHVYHLVPDHALAWRDRIADFATRPAWLWSAAGDARPTGDEPLVLSEFGSWGLPDPRPFRVAGEDPWWFATGPLAGRPGGIEERFAAAGLERQFGDLAGLVTATQEHQWEALRYEIAELRRHASIAGYVITELSDIYWEANGLLDMARRPKAFHERFAGINAPTVVVGELEPRDCQPGDRLSIPVTVSSWGGPPSTGGTVRWELVVDGAPAGPPGKLAFEGWPAGTASQVGSLLLEVPGTPCPSRAELRMRLHDAEGRHRASAALPFAIVPLDAGAADPFRLARHLGVRLVDRLDASVTARIRSGERVVLVARGPEAIDPAAGLPLPLRVHPRSAPHPDVPAAGPVWDGDWITTFAWARSWRLAALTAGRCLDLAFARVLPDHVIPATWASQAPAEAADVEAGLFAGWVQAPAALTLGIPLGGGRLVVTTMRNDPARGPVAAHLLAEAIEAAAR